MLQALRLGAVCELVEVEEPLRLDFGYGTSHFLAELADISDARDLNGIQRRLLGRPYCG